MNLSLHLSNCFELGLFDKLGCYLVITQFAPAILIISSQTQLVQFSLYHLGHYSLRVQWYSSIWNSVLMYSLDNMIAEINSIYCYVEFILNLSIV
jgi:hypothetical protein